MTTFELLSLLVTLAALFSWLNHRYLRLPTTIGLMVISMFFSLALVGLAKAGFTTPATVTEILGTVDFDAALLDGMLGALLFAGALHININDLREQKWVITLLATVGVLLSAALVGSGIWLLSGELGVELRLSHAFLFGALISPTDPIAVGAILRTVGVPKRLLVKLTGESLFNDGVGVVLFLLVLEIGAGSSGAADAGVLPAEANTGLPLLHALHLVAVEVGGGIFFGALVGWAVYRMLRAVDAYQVEILLTLALVTGGYAVAHALHVSGPLAMVVAGLLIGNRGRALAMSAETVRHLDSFWELADDFLNAVLFVMIGVEILILDLELRALVLAAIAIPIVLGARFVSAGVPVALLRSRRSFTPHVVKLLTWSGLRGGISVALALSVPPGPERDLILTVTYVVVVFSIIVQGLTVGPLARRLIASPSD